MTFIHRPSTRGDMFESKRDEVLAISWDGCIYSTEGFPERTSLVMCNLSTQKKELFSLSIEMKCYFDDGHITLVLFDRFKWKMEDSENIAICVYGSLELKT